VNELPTGTVTFVFTDIEGSTHLAQSLGDAWPPALERHRAVIREAVRRHGGHEFGTEGDACSLVFASASEAVEGAADIQRGLAEAGREGAAPIRVRIGVHTGAGVLQDGDYVGLDLPRVAASPRPAMADRCCSARRPRG
jgi:class 3 adenylate cyclase